MRPAEWMASAAKSWKVRFDPLRYTNPRIRLLERCEIKGDCWVSSVPSVRIEGKAIAVQRAAYVLFEGPAYRGDEIISFCRNERCCCPDHLQRVPREAIAKAKKSKANANNGTP
mgnify:CR=1 FL=1